MDNRGPNARQDQSMLKVSSSDGLVTVTFVVPAAAGAKTAAVAGDFTAWVECPMFDESDGSFSFKAELEHGHRYRFRYRLDGERWENDWSADEYVPNDFGGDDSVVVV